MNGDTLREWRTLLTHVVGMYAFHPDTLSTRMLQRRIQGLSSEDARLLLALMALLLEILAKLDAALVETRALDSQVLDFPAESRPEYRAIDSSRGV